MSAYMIEIIHMTGISLDPVECLRLLNAVLNWKSHCFCRFGDSHCQVFVQWRMGRGKCGHQEPRNLEPRKLILETDCHENLHPQK